MTNEWCTAGLEALDDESCFVLPALAEGQPRRLLVYLHGIVPPVPASPVKENLMTVVRNAVTRAGAAALVPRGVRGIGPRGSKDWWAWPTAPGKDEALARSLVARIVAEKKVLEAIAGAPFERTYVAGSSNGAYFVTSLAVRNELGADGYGAMSGGGPARITARIPFYVGFGTHDEQSKRNGLALGRVLDAAAVPSRIAEHPFGHGAREVYIDEAFAFWDASLDSDAGR
jgi:predicted esterase